MSTMSFGRFFNNFLLMFIQFTEASEAFMVSYCRLTKGYKLVEIHYSTSTSMYLLKINNRHIRTMCEISSKLTIKTILVSLLLTLNGFHTLF